MQYAILGNTGLVVSRLAFGAMTFTAGDRSMGSVYKTEAAAANELVGQALDAGINFFDTADAYASGQSETMLGAALKARRGEVIISTKVGFRTGGPLTQAGLSRRHILWSIDQSLKRLGTDWIDIYIVHKEDPHTPLEETLAALGDVVRSGKTRYIGFSFPVSTSFPSTRSMASASSSECGRLPPTGRQGSRRWRSRGCWQNGRSPASCSAPPSLINWPTISARPIWS
jgi:aryl-alcohol dehydrogenase-like predicted oxidoreductase